MNGNSELSGSSSGAELCLCKAPIKSLNAITNSGENSNLVLDRLQANWPKTRLLWPGAGRATWPLLVGREDVCFFAPIHPMARAL